MLHRQTNTVTKGHNVHDNEKYCILCLLTLYKFAYLSNVYTYLQYSNAESNIFCAECKTASFVNLHWSQIHEDAAYNDAFLTFTVDYHIYYYSIL